MLKRVIGLIVIALVVAVVLMLLPKRGHHEATSSVPVVAVPLGASGPAPGTTNAPPTQSAPIIASGANAGTSAPELPAGHAQSKTRQEKPEPGPRYKKATPPPPPAKPASVQMPKGRFYVQVASFRDAANAQRALSRLEKKGYHGVLRNVTVHGERWKRVQVGPYRTLEKANAARDKLLAGGYKGSRVVSLHYSQSRRPLPHK